jgi:hypothetical protein
MTQKRRHIPAYRPHKASGQARVIINREHIYLGKFGSPESQEKYHRLVAEWIASGRTPAKTPDPAPQPVSVNELLLAFSADAARRYVKDGRPTSEINSYKIALGPVRLLYGCHAVANFGPLALIACREKLIEAGICRKRINQHVGRIRHVFK